MTDPRNTRSDLVAGVEAAGLVLAQRLGLGEAARSAEDWPIDEGDAVLQMAVAGDPASSLVLAVNDEVADQLLGNPAVLADAFGAAIMAVNAAAGTSLAPTTVVREPSVRPALIAEISDGGQLTAVAGLTLSDASLAAAQPHAHAPAAAQAPTYQPTSFDPSALVPHHIGAPSSLTVLHDVELVVTAELGRTTMPVRDLLGLTPGMVVEIDRAAGAPIDLLVNGRRIAAGEVVVIDEEFGIRITEIAPTGEHSR
ncbi:MAG: flagellar motor switch protein FliN [Ilumatobacteraceae bacterium]|nr:flagellar motor switch protein FliN [Ilumatobacteraceae bacterium]